AEDTDAGPVMRTQGAGPADAALPGQLDQVHQHGATLQPRIAAGVEEIPSGCDRRSDDRFQKRFFSRRQLTAVHEYPGGAVRGVGLERAPQRQSRRQEPARPLPEDSGRAAARVVPVRAWQGTQAEVLQGVNNRRLQGYAVHEDMPCDAGGDRRRMAMPAPMGASVSGLQVFGEMASARGKTREL